MAVFLPHGSRVVFGSQINRTQLGAHLRTCLKKLTYLVIQAVPFLSPIVGGHQQPLKRVTFSPSQKGHGLNHQANGFFLLAMLGLYHRCPTPKPTNPWSFHPAQTPPAPGRGIPALGFWHRKKPSLKLTDKTPEFSGHLISGNEIRRIPTIHVERCKLLVSGRVQKKKTYMPCDSSCDLCIPDRWRSLDHPKKVTKTCQELFFFQSRIFERVPLRTNEDWINTKKMKTRYIP